MVQADLRSLSSGRRPDAGSQAAVQACPVQGSPRLAALMATVGVIGLGYVGLPLAVAFAQEGCDVVAVDSDPRKIEAIAAGDSYVEDVSSERLREVAGRIHATTRYARLAKADAVLICVPTPLTRNREPDLGPLIDATRALAEVLQAGQLVVLESTTYPGTTRERVAPLLEESGLGGRQGLPPGVLARAGGPGPHRLHAAQHPEGGGWADRGVRGARARSSTGWCAISVVRVSSPEAAELTKLLENIFRSVNIALVNELAMLTDRMGIDIWEVVEAAATKPYGFMRFEPGPGHGRTLPAGRPVLPELARAGVRHDDRVHRAGGQGQPADALPLRRQGRSAR